MSDIVFVQIFQESFTHKEFSFLNVEDKSVLYSQRRNFERLTKVKRDDQGVIFEGNSFPCEVKA